MREGPTADYAHRFAIIGSRDCRYQLVTAEEACYPKATIPAYQ